MYRRKRLRPSPRKINAKDKIVDGGGLSNSYEKKKSERQRRKGKIYPCECSVQKNRKYIRKPYSVISAKKKRKTREWERLEISSRKLEIPREHSCKDGHNKGQKWYVPNRNGRY